MIGDTLFLFKLYLITAPILFVVGIYAIITTRNIIAMIIGIEVMMKGVTVLLAAAGYFNGKPQVVEPLIITMIVVEVVILMISAGYIINIVKKHDSLDVANINKLKG
ncbi:MAG: NADH-quinone oxidoreductase subunit K [Endomicrobia bacterium]|nr:NADH-quinone oxidoreductase subunit K [Endomicrobiia bacterium]MCL2507469.1 NADH-quinone oxidoreductase subunit K [Endomicrobiia bacterium]